MELTFVRCAVAAPAHCGLRGRNVNYGRSESNSKATRRIPPAKRHERHCINACKSGPCHGYYWRRVDINISVSGAFRSVSRDRLLTRRRIAAVANQRLPPSLSPGER